MQPDKPTYKRDDSFYFEDGSCIFLVENTLFNVHRSLLSRDSSSFTNMFTLPQGDKPVQGKSDDNPVLLLGDTVTEFKHFLWALYALPSEIAAVSSQFGDLTLLSDIAQVANKYFFKSVETWALDVVYARVSRIQQRLKGVDSGTHTSPSFQLSKTGSSIPVDDIPMDQFTRLLRLSQICVHEPLLDAIVSILSHSTKTSLQHAFRAMNIADELDIPSLRGVAYLEVLQKCSIDNWIVPGFKQLTIMTSQRLSQSVQDKDSPSPDEELPEITPAQRSRLLTGYYRMSRFWERTRLTPPEFDHALACGATWHQRGCTLSWVEFWREKARSETILNLDVADVLGKLRHIEKEYARLGNTTYMHHDCRLMAKECLAVAVKNIEDNLYEFFSDPLL
ncbi:hypothetical protein M378DRAFT_188059 [Amanita muscaria Koide BX008]|uniref:BTB domain-containing protein n=1 Tax=Amanita muscaria (strain Koide BX008) TaxID=946122 RepID=A0A0C2S8H2_AMAMK|nr:hypothetical protein M378DRAFT_188059 [Amanita muscaria Koide BX008]